MEKEVVKEKLTTARKKKKRPRVPYKGLKVGTSKTFNKF